MMKFNFCSINLLLTVILLVPYSVYASGSITKIPVTGYCLDDQCSKPISRAELSVRFISQEACVLSGKPTNNVTVYGKPDNKRLFVLVEINGKRGFFPQNLLRERKGFVRKEEVNIPVEFKCSDKQVTITKAAPKESSSSLPEATDITSSSDSNSTLFQESPIVPSVPLKDQGSKGYFFPHASAAEASESSLSDYAPGHPPHFPSSKEQADEVTTAPSSTKDSLSGDSSQTVLENKNIEAEPNTSDVLNEADAKKEKEAGSNDESSTEDTSAGMEDEEEEEEEDDDDDGGIDVESENINYAAPVVSSLQSSINDKTETVNEISSTPPVYPSASLESSLGIGTPLQTPVVPSTGLPLASSSQTPIDIQSSKPEIAGFSPSDAPHADPVQSDQNQEEIATTEPPITRKANPLNQSSPENVLSTVTPLNQPDSNTLSSQSESSEAESGLAASSRDSSLLPILSDKPNFVSDSANESLPPEKSVPETGSVNFTGGSPSTTVSSTGDNTPIELGLSSSGGGATQNETTSAPEEAKSVDPIDPISSDIQTSVNKSVFSESKTSQERISESQQEAAPAPNMFYHKPLLHPQYAHPAPTVLPSGHPSKSQPLHQPSPTAQPPAELPAPDLIQPVKAPLEVQEFPPPSTPSPLSDSLQPVIPPVNTLESLPPPTPSPLSDSLQPVIPPVNTLESLPPPTPSPLSDSLQPVIPPVNTLESLPPPTPSPLSDSLQPVIPPLNNQESPPPPPPILSPFSDSLPPVIPPLNSREPLLPPSSSPLSPPPDAMLSSSSPTQSPVSEESLPPQSQSIHPSNLYETLSPTPFFEDGGAGQPTTEEKPVVITPQENYETPSTPSAILEENNAAEQAEGDPETSTSLWDSILSLFWSSEPSIEPLQADGAAPEVIDQVPSDSKHTSLQDVLQKDGVEVTICPDGYVGPDCSQQPLLPFQIDYLFSNIGVDSLITRIIAAAVTLLLCIIAYFFFENRRMDSSLVARVNTLERQLMVLSKENSLLKEECSSNIGQGQLEVFLEELKEAKAAKAELEEQVATLERDLDEAAEANMELNQMLAQTLENPKDSTDDVLASVERLQAQLDGQRNTIGNMTRSISSKNAEIENLKIQLIECRETISGLEAEVITLNETVGNIRREKEDASIAHVEKLQEVQNQLAEVLANKVLEESRLGSELSSVKLNLKKTRQIVVAKESEVEALKESFKELKSKGAGEETIGKLFDAVKLHAQVEQTTQERNELEDSLRGETEARKRLEDHVRVIEEEVSKLRVNYEDAQKEKAEAQTRLEVLSNYFKEKEAQLKKDLDLQEILLAQQRGDENSVLRRVKTLQEEVENYRSQNESLKSEILDQERDFKGQMATLEKKSHDNWVSARQAERKLEESRQEASLLRNRLTLVEKNLSGSSDLSGVEANGEGGIISPVMGLPGMGPMGALMGPMGPLIPPPPPPIDLDSSSGLPPFMFPPLSPGSMPPPHFIHPLPPPLMAGDRRPPPLGRMSSPPPAPPPPPGHFSPPPPHFDRLDRPSQSPSPTYHRSPAGGAGERQGFRPFAKPNPRKPTDYRGPNLSSGQSNEPMEKTRTNERV